MSQLKKVETPNAPAVLGPYSQAIKAGSFLFISGQISIDPKTGEVVKREIEAQTKQVLNNIEAVLESEGLLFKHVIKSEAYLKGMEDFKK